MWSFLSPNKTTLPSKEDALPGRENAIAAPNQHFVLKNKMIGPFDKNLEQAMFGMGCFWGVEKLFWPLDGVYSTAVGYSAGHTVNPNYDEVCSGRTGHNEVVKIVFDPTIVAYQELLKIFWQNHNPTTGMQQANDVGTQYRSGIYTFDDKQLSLAEQSKEYYQDCINQNRRAQDITTEIIPVTEFYFAEEYHQQYLAKNPGGYCNMQGCSITGLPAY